jgi:multidrug efflux pump subunit AcrA (membrane-fusion protein)
VASPQTTAGTSATSYTQVVAVARGNLVASITPTGEVYAPKQAELTFPASGLTVLEVNVAAGQYVEEGTVLARVDPAPLQKAVDQARAEYLSAKKAWEEAQKPYSELDQKKAELAVAQAQVALEEAKQKLEDTLHPDLEKAQRAVAQAQYELQSARLNLTITQHSTAVGKTVRDLEYALAWHQRKVRDLKAAQGKAGASSEVQAASPAPPGPSRRAVEEPTLEEELAALAEVQAQLEAARAAASAALTEAEDRVAQAEQALADAQEALAELQAGPDPVAVAQARNTVAQAEYNLAKAQDDLQTLLAGPNPDDLALAEARYKAAEAALAEAEANLEGAVLRAPFTGTVLAVNVQPGDKVSSNQVAIVLADLRDLRVLAYVDETEISQVERGQEVVVTFDAFPGKRFTGKVLEVPLQGKLVGNVVTYEVPVSLEGVEGVPLKPGMTANLRVVVGRREQVLLVPAMAVEQTDEGYVVRVVELDGSQGVVPVEVGLSDGVYTEVVRGLNEGDQVIVQVQSTTSTTGMFGAMRRVEGEPPAPPPGEGGRP